MKYAPAKMCVHAKVLCYAVLSCYHYTKHFKHFILSATAIVGDIAPSDNVSKGEKRRLEEDAMQKIHCMLGEGSTAGVALLCQVQALLDTEAL